MTTRRRFLVASGAVGVTGLAGCSEITGGGGGEASTDEPFCDDLTAGGYDRYDEEDSAFVGTFEYPLDPDGGDTMFGGGRANDTINRTVHVTADGNQFTVLPTQDVAGTESMTDAMQGNVDGLEQVGDLEFNGETVPVVRADGGSNGDDAVDYYKEYPYYLAGLPHEGSSGKLYYRFSALGTVQFADGLEPTVCVNTWEEVSRHMVESLEYNPDTTAESTGLD